MGETATEIRKLWLKIDELNGRLERSQLAGEVVEVKGDKVRLRLRQKDEATGKEFLSPWVRWQGQSGSEKGGFSITTRPAVGEKMRLLSPSGDIGSGSLAVPDSFTDDDPNPDAGADFKLKSGSAHIAFTQSGIELMRGGVGVKITDKVETVGPTHLDGGSRKVHFVGGKDTDGDTAVDGANRVFV